MNLQTLCNEHSHFFPLLFNRQFFAHGQKFDFENRLDTDIQLSANFLLCLATAHEIEQLVIFAASLFGENGLGFWRALFIVILNAKI